MCIEYYVFSLDDEMMELYYVKTPLEEKKSKLESDIAVKMLEKG